MGLSSGLCSYGMASWVCLSVCVLMAKLLFPLCLSSYGLTRCGFPQDLCSYMNARKQIILALCWHGMTRWGFSRVSILTRQQDECFLHGSCCYEMARWICLNWWLEWSNWFVPGWVLLWDGKMGLPQWRGGWLGGIVPGFVLWDGKMGFPLWTPALNVILHHPWPLCHQEDDGGKADEEDAPPDEDLYEKAEKEFWDIINSEKKKMPDPTQDFEKSDTGKVNILVAIECDGVYYCTACHHTSYREWV